MDKEALNGLAMAWTCCGAPLAMAAFFFFIIRGINAARKGKVAVQAAQAVATRPRLIKPDGEAILLRVGGILIIGSDPSADIVIPGLEPKHAEIFTYQGTTVTTWRMKKLAGQITLVRLPPGVPSVVVRKAFGQFPLKFQDGDRLEFVAGSGTSAVTTKITARIP